MKITIRVIPQAMALGRISSALVEKQNVDMTYSAPIRKIPATASLLRSGICSPKICGLLVNAIVFIRLPLSRCDNTYHRHRHEHDE